MAGVVPRTILVCAFPALLSLLTFLWIRKKKNKSNDQHASKSLTDSQDSARTSSEMVTKKKSAEVHVAERKKSVDEPPLQKQEGNLQLAAQSGSSTTCSSDKIEDSACLDETNRLEQLTLCQAETKLVGSEEKDSSAKVAECSHGDRTDQERTDPDSSASGAHSLPENSTQSPAEVAAATRENSESSLAMIDTPDIVIESESSLEETQTDDNFALSGLKLFEIETGEEPEVQTGVTIGSFDSVNYSEMDDLTDSPPHSTYSDVQSEGSSDSGKGGSDIQAGSDLSQTTTGEDAVLIYEFELPQDLCGRLIGRLGKYVNFIKSRSGASVFIKRHLFNPRVKICAVEGNQSEIKNALELIRKRFPLSQFPNVDLTQVNVPVPCGVMVPETLQLHLPEGVTSDVILSSMVSAGHFFVQQPTHPTYPSLNRLDQCMMVCYSQMETPELPQPVEVGVICAAPTMGGWYRASVVHVYENSEECDVKFVDYGGYSCTSVSSLRQIRSDFMTLPFQASECYLANVKPTNDNAGWSLEACATFEELAQGQILQSLIVAHAEDGVPYVHLYRIQGVSTIFINRELVNRGVAQWVEHQL